MKTLYKYWIIYHQLHLSTIQVSYNSHVWTYLHPSRLFQVALSAANHFCTTDWSEVPRWTRSCWVRISCVVCLKAAKNQRCGRSKKSNTRSSPTLPDLRSLWQWFPPFSKPNFRSEVGWSQAERKVSLGNPPWDQYIYIYQTVMGDIKLCYVDFTPCLPWYPLFFTSPYEGQLG